jgi:hypothetical protein
MKFKIGDKVRFTNKVQCSSEPMVVKAVLGDQVWLDSPSSSWWHRNSLILDSEWGPTKEKLAKENALPLIEKGIPAPAYAKKPDLRQKRPPSKWPAFLKSLKPGDSFLVEYPAATSVKAHARALKIPLIWRTEGKGPEGMAQERFWRVKPLYFHE